MKRRIKFFFIAAFSIFSFSTKGFALGAGIQFSGIPGLLINQDEVTLGNMTGNVTGTYRLERVPLTVGSGLEFGEVYSDFDYGFSLFADYRAFNFQLINAWSFYSGFGAVAKLLTSDFSDWNVAAGARFFAGMNWLFYDGYLELYVQQNVVPTYLRNDFMLNLPLETGVRMHF